MRNQFRIRMTHLQLRNLLQTEYLMHHARSIPQKHVAPGCLVDVRTQVLIRRKDYLLLLRKTIHHQLCIAAGTDHITQCLDTRTAVDVTHYHMVGVLFPEFLEKRWRTTIAERTTSMQVRNHNLSAWVEDLGRLRH